MQSHRIARRGAQPRRRRGTGGVARRLLAGAAVSGVVVGGINVSPTFAAPAPPPSVTAAFSGGSGTANVGGTLYARQGGALTLTVNTSSDTQCIAGVPAGFSGATTSTTAQSTWTFTGTAGTGDGVKNFTLAASPGFNKNGACTGTSASGPASYTLDNIGPVVTAALTPAANAAGWNNSNVTVKWTATDAGSGVPAAQPFQTDSVSSNGIATVTAPGQSDALGNAGAGGSVTVRVDKAAPTITAAQTQNADGSTTVTFTCTDSNSGGQGSGIATCLADGSTTSSKTVQPGVTVTGTATDVAGNTATASSTAPAPPKDTTPPTIGHTVTPAPNTAGWNKSDATVTFSCADEAGGSGVASCLADGSTTASRTISTETNGTLVSGTAKDKAGNTATDSVTVKLDKTAPTATAKVDRPANTNGWYNNDVTVSFAGSDSLSGVASKTADQVLGQGANQSATGTATDAAGNTSAPVSVTGINIDKTAPTLAGAPTTNPNTAGWYNGDVKIHWTAADQAGLSGIDGASPADSTITGEGSALKASASVSDRAGNTTTSDRPAVKIDRTAPITAVSGTSNAWTNGNVTVTLVPGDNLSGVASTQYAVDGGSYQSGTTFVLSTEGDHIVSFFSTDVAGNAESPSTIHVKVDKTAPTIGHAFTPQSYVDGAWTNGNVGVAFTCADQGGSGVASCTGDATVSAEGANQKVTGTATDNAGNTATDSALVSIDKTAPTISGSTDRAANLNSWYKNDVTVSFAAADALSGVASKTADKTLGEGSNQSVTGTATDAAGNAASATVSGINIDKTPPVLTGSFSSGWHTGDVTVAWTCIDPLSGPAAQPADSTVTGDGDNLTATATCTDRAGNSTTTSVSGIQIDRTAPTTSASVSGQVKNGWYNADVSFTLTGSDNLSGVANTFYSIDGAPAQAYNDAVVIGTNGTHTVTYWSTDKAGNVEDKTGNSITLKLDKTPPALDGKVTTAPNAKGWYKDDVTVAWTCSDTGSGLDGTCPADSTVTGEGDNLGASASISDLAGNVTNRTVDGIHIDRIAPTTTVTVPDVPTSGWYRDAITVTLSGHDNLSQVASTFYSVDGGDAQTYAGPFSFGTEGTHDITFWSIDNAGNVETAGPPITISIDKTAPTTTVINPISPATGWFVTSGIPFAFTATDNDGGSGLAATYFTIDGTPHTYGDPYTEDLSTGSHAVTYWSVDSAGNKEGVHTLTVQVDTTPPTITGDTVNVDGTHRQANAAGWFNSPVDVKFTCADVGSGLQTGVAGCAGDTTLSNDGAGQKVHGDAVDVAGNRSGADVTGINIDQTKPTLVGVPADANGAGWYRDDVAVKWVGDDAGSQIDPASQPADSTITGEGSNLGAGPVTIKDNAGNVSDPASVTGIKIDRTAPLVTGAPTTSPNGAGWFNSAVTVDFKCSDPKLADGSAGSGVASCPTSKVIKGDGVNQSVTSDSATDVAGNTSAGKTIGGINIDGTAPSTTSNNQCTATNGYCTGSTANVVLTATDQAGLSGVKEIHYVIDSGAEQVVAGAATTVSVPLTGSGAGTVKYWAVDNAGNVEAPNSVGLKWDNIAPTVTHTLSPAANAAGWNNADTTVTFSAKDDDNGSGVASVTAPVTVSTETAGQLVTGTAKDTAGNVGTDSVTVKLDKTKPTIIGAVTSGAKGNNGWYVGPVTVTFTCSDALSGVATCPDPVVLSANGANTATGTATDNAGNTATATVSGINIDQEKPTLTTAGVNVQGGTYTLGSVPTATCTATDSFSGVASCTVTVTGGNANGVGTFTYTATATDKAGNTTTITGSYSVIYRWDGFLQPINDTAHQVGTSTSIFKAGSTVPVKFQVKNAAGTVVQYAGTASWLTPVKGSAMSAPVDETVYTASADSGSIYKYDSTAQQYIYNWKAPSTGGNYYRIGVTLDDGQTYYVNIGLR